MLTAENKQVKHGLNILRLPEAAHLLEKVAVIHCRGHQTGNMEIIKGNNKQKQPPKGGPRTSNLVITLIPKRPDPSNYSPVYTKEAAKPRNGASICNQARPYGAFQDRPPPSSPCPLPASCLWKTFSLPGLPLVTKGWLKN